ncbi:MAG: transposase family protein [Candidatus Wallbacteria bacterium]|nr:transposase family protein [Candidatus Wallbacteria bacterium]
MAFLSAEKLRDRRSSIPELILRARQKGVVSAVTPVSRTSAYRFLLRQGISAARVQQAAERDSRRFAYPHRLQMVLADGKHFRAGASRLKRVALFFIDDATRLGLSVCVAPSEDTGVFLKSFHALVCQYGFPDTVFVDNGPGFISEATLGVFARLDLPLIHGTAAYPEGHGKIERFNQTAKAAVLRQLAGRPEIDPSCESLTLRLTHYLREVYNHLPHESLAGNTPWERFRSDEKPFRWPEDRARLDEKFSVHLKRRVSPDHIVDIGDLAYEIPRGHAGRHVVLEQKLLDDRVFFIDRGRAIELFPVDLARNARERRGSDQKTILESQDPAPPGAAELAFNKSFAPVVDADGGFLDPVTRKGRPSR